MKKRTFSQISPSQPETAIAKTPNGKRTTHRSARSGGKVRVADRHAGAGRRCRGGAARAQQSRRAEDAVERGVVHQVVHLLGRVLHLLREVRVLLLLLRRRRLVIAGQLRAPIDLWIV